MSDVEKLSRLYMFGTVPRPSLEALLAAAPPVTFKPGDAVFRQGTAADVALLLVEGKLVATVYSASGKESRSVGDIRPGEILGEQALFQPGGRRSATVTAAEPSVALLFTPALLEAAATNPAVAALEQYLLGTLARRIRKTNQAIQQVWKAEATPEQKPDAPKQSLRDRLRSLLGGG